MERTLNDVFMDTALAVVYCYQTSEQDTCPVACPFYQTDNCPYAKKKPSLAEYANVKKELKEIRKNFMENVENLNKKIRKINQAIK